MTLHIIRGSVNFSMIYNTVQSISGTAGGDCLFNKALLSCYEIYKGLL